MTNDSFKPSYNELEIYYNKEKHYNEHNILIPIYTNIAADIDTPVSIFLRLKESYSLSESCFLLESVTLGKSISRYSFIGINPFLIIETGDKENMIRFKSNTNMFTGDPFIYLENELNKYKMIIPDELDDVPFLGGAVGYSSFDTVRYFEPKINSFINKQKDILKIPESIYMLYDTIIVFDHAFQSLKIISHCYLKKNNILSKNLILEYDETITKLKLLKSLILDNSKPLNYICHEDKNTRSNKINWENASNIGKDGYKSYVEILKKHIVDGDIFQAVPSQRLTIPIPNNIAGFDLYRQMRIINPSPYMFYLQLSNKYQIIGASPEMLLRVDKNRKIEIHPIAGTRKRGKTSNEDECISNELLNDEKERAEHIMLVDLGRNDVGKVAKIGSVKVESLMKIEKYSHVMHIVSIVTGILDDNKTIFDAYRAVFPAGTLSGAPKVKAMELVCGLEKERRGVYSGSVGYFGFNKRVDTAIAIRTIILKDYTLYCQAGGGIVYDSEPEKEYEETVNKLASVIRTIDIAISNKKYQI